MGVIKDYSRRVQDAGVIDTFQTLTQATTGVTVNAYGVTHITNSSADNGWKMDAPVQGVRKTIIYSPTTGSTGVGSLYLNSTLTFFHGSTFNAITFTTSTGTGPFSSRVVELLGMSATAWKILSQSSTAITLAGSTVSL